ncbi:MAG: SDR family NAD(P)-dependent oxidoreductase, partial [Rubrobacter sp.]|nr:SDR family NAD(P)-dependent oxidoreductase [Rubrobacter sp.]
MAGLEGKVAVVTGGGGGLGTAICSRLSSEGAAVAVVEQELEKAERVADAIVANGGRALAVEADVSDKGSVEAMAERVTDELGSLDVLVNNAAIYPRRAWTEIEEEEWDRV